MNMIIRGGVMLGVLVTIWSWAFAFIGLHKNPNGSMIFPIVATLIEIAVLIWALKKTAAQGRGWIGQVSAGTLLAFVGGSLIFATSYMLVTSLYPTYVAEANAAMAEAFRARGMDDAAVQAEMAKMAPGQTPVMLALTGFAATVVTGLVVSMIIATFVRNKGPRPVAA